METQQVTNPLFRQTLCEVLAGLMDERYQQQRWADGDYPSGSYTFDMMLAFLFDDTEVAFDAERSIGIILLDAKEAEKVMIVGDTIRVLRQRHGIDLQDKAYMAQPEWRDVVVAARAAHELICRNSSLDAK